MCDDERFRGGHPGQQLYENDDFSRKELDVISATLLRTD